MTVANSGMTLYQDMDTDTNWTGEDGQSTEEFQQGTASQQWIVAKSGDETAVLSLAADMTSAKYIIMPVISFISAFYTLISVNLKDGTNTELFTLADQLGGSLHRAVAGQWKFNNHCMQFGNNGGSLVLANITGFDLRCDNSLSGNIRSVLNTYMDAIYYGTGRTIAGTTVGDKLFTESNDLDVSGDVFDGCTLEFEGEVFVQTDVVVNTTTGNSYGETLVFRDAPNTDGAFTLSITGIAHFKNTIKASGTARVSLDASAATAFTHESASVTKGGTITYAVGQTVDAVVYTDCTDFVIPNAPTGCTYDTSGMLVSTGIVSNATFNKSIAAVSQQGTSLDRSDNCTYISDGSNHAFELTGVAGSYPWTGILSGYDAGVTGDGVEITGGAITGNEAIHITAVTGTFIINVSDTATIPSVSSAGAIVNVISGQKTFSFTLNPSITGYEWRIYTVNGAGSLDGSVEIAGEEVASVDNQSHTYTYSVDTIIAIQILSVPYEEEIIYDVLKNADKDITINLTVDNND